MAESKPKSRKPELKAYQPNAAGPLRGIRVLDLTRLVAGNMLTHVMADFGAEVIKIERPGKGDDLRAWRINGVSAYWKVYARSKKSVTLNVRKPEGRALLLRLVRRSQVLVENYLPGTLEKWGLGPDILHEQNPNLVVVRISGWGQTGPFREKPGFGSLVEAMSGFAAINGFPDRPPVLPPLALADMIAGLYGVVATLVAVRNLEVLGGKGQVIDLPLFDPLFSVMGPQAAAYQLTGSVDERAGSRSTTAAPRNVYRCNDGRYVALSASMQSMVDRLFRAIGREDLIDDPKFKTNAERVANIDELDQIIGEFIVQRTQEENLALFEAAGVTLGPVYDISQLIGHPYILDREVIVNYPDGEMGSLPMHNVVPTLSETPGTIRHPAPSLGEHNAAILGELGLTTADLERLAAEEIV